MGFVILWVFVSWIMFGFLLLFLVNAVVLDCGYFVFCLLEGFGVQYFVFCWILIA